MSTYDTHEQQLEGDRERQPAEARPRQHVAHLAEAGRQQRDQDQRRQQREHGDEPPREPARRELVGERCGRAATRGTLPRGKIPAVDRLRQTLATIEAAFADAPRPPDGELLHERCFDDNDIVRSTACRTGASSTTRRRARVRRAVVPEPGRLPALHPRLPGFALRHLDRGAPPWTRRSGAVAGATSPGCRRSRSSSSARRASERVAFLDAVRELGDEHVAAEAELALRWWRA